MLKRALCVLYTAKTKCQKVGNKYSQKRNIGASVPISTFMGLWANYIFRRWVCLFCWRKYVDRPWVYINRSQTHECGTWGWGRAIPRQGIYKRNCCCNVLLLRVRVLILIRSNWFLCIVLGPPGHAQAFPNLRPGLLNCRTCHQKSNKITRESN